MDMFKGKGLSMERRGDTIRTSLSYRGKVYYEKEVALTDKKGMEMLFQDLASKGVQIPNIENIGWFY